MNKRDPRNRAKAQAGSQLRAARPGGGITPAKSHASDMNLVQQALAVDKLGRAEELLDRQSTPGRLICAVRIALSLVCQSDAQLVLGQKPLESSR